MGGGPSPELKALSIALANKTPLPSGVKADVFDRSTGKRTGETVDVGGRVVTGNVYSDQIDKLTGQLKLSQEAAAAAEAEATAEKAKGSTTTTLIGGGNAATAGKNPYATASFSLPTFDQNRYMTNFDFFNKMFDPGATVHTTPATRGLIGVDGGAGNGAGGGGGYTWGGGGYTWGDGSGQYTPGISGDGQALTATRNLNVPGGAPTPTSKPQANQAGVPDTGGQSAANATQAPGMSGLQKSLQALYDTLANFDVNALFATSDPVDNAISNMDDALSKAYESALADLPDYEKMKKDAEDLHNLKADLLEDRRKTLEARYNADKKSIEADYDVQEYELKESQKGQTGRMAGGLASAGAYLGFDNVNHSAMLSLQVTHDREMTVLGQAKIAALSEARRAFEDADFALLTEHINAIEAYDKKITDLANTNFIQTLQLTQEARANVKFMQDTETFNRAKSFDNLDAIIEAGTIPTDADIREYAAKLNLSPEDVRGYITSKQNTKALVDQQQKTENELAILRVLSGMDKGQYVTIGGKTYEGLNIPAKSGSSSSDALTYEDVFNDFNSSPLARQFVGYPKEQLYKLMTSEYPPEELEASIADSIPDLSADQNVAAAQIQTAWQNMRNDTLGITTSRDLARFTGTQQAAIVAEINQQIDEGTLTDFEGQLNLQDITNDPNTFDYATLATFLRQAEARGAKKSDSELLLERLGL